MFRVDVDNKGNEASNWKGPLIGMNPLWGVRSYLIGHPFTGQQGILLISHQPITSSSTRFLQQLGSLYRPGVFGRGDDPVMES